MEEIPVRSHSPLLELYRVRHTHFIQLTHIHHNIIIGEDIWENEITQ